MVLVYPGVVFSTGKYVGLMKKGQKLFEFLKLRRSMFENVCQCYKIRIIIIYTSTTSTLPLVFVTNNVTAPQNAHKRLVLQVLFK